MSHTVSVVFLTFVSRITSPSLQTLASFVTKLFRIHYIVIPSLQYIFFFHNDLSLFNFIHLADVHVFCPTIWSLDAYILRLCSSDFRYLYTFQLTTAVCLLAVGLFYFCKLKPRTGLKELNPLTHSQKCVMFRLR